MKALGKGHILCVRVLAVKRPGNELVAIPIVKYPADSVGGLSNFSINGLELLNQKHMSPSMEAVTEFHDHRWVDMGKLKDLEVASSWHFALKGY